MVISYRWAVGLRCRFEWLQKPRKQMNRIYAATKNKLWKGSISERFFFFQFFFFDDKNSKIRSDRSILFHPSLCILNPASFILRILPFIFSFLPKFSLCLFYIPLHWNCITDPSLKTNPAHYRLNFSLISYHCPRFWISLPFRHKQIRFAFPIPLLAKCLTLNLPTRLTTFAGWNSSSFIYNYLPTLRL